MQATYAPHPCGGFPTTVPFCSTKPYLRAMSKRVSKCLKQQGETPRGLACHMATTRRRVPCCTSLCLPCIQPPGNRVELQLQLVGDPRRLQTELLLECEIIKSFDGLLLTASALEIPAPDDLLAVGDGDEDGLDARVGGCVLQTGDVGLFGGGGDGAELQYRSS